MNAPETLFICPCCATAGFSATGLHRHHCHSKPDRARLTLVEIAAARPVTPPATLKTLNLPSVKGGAS